MTINPIAFKNPFFRICLPTSSLSPVPNPAAQFPLQSPLKFQPAHPQRFSSRNPWNPQEVRSLAWSFRPLPLGNSKIFLSRASFVESVQLRMLFDPDYSMQNFARELLGVIPEERVFSFLRQLGELVGFASRKDLKFLTQICESLRKSIPDAHPALHQLREFEAALLARRVRLGEVGLELERRLLAAAILSDAESKVDCLALLLALPDRDTSPFEICRGVWRHYAKVREGGIEEISVTVRTHLNVLDALEAEFGRTPSDAEMKKACPFLNPELLRGDGADLFADMTRILLDPLMADIHNDVNGSFRRLYLRLFQQRTLFARSESEREDLYENVMRVFSEPEEPVLFSDDLLPALLDLLPHFREHNAGLWERAAQEIRENAEAISTAQGYGDGYDLIRLLQNLDSFPAEFLDAEKVKTLLLKILREAPADEDESWPAAQEAAQLLLKFGWVRDEDWSAVERFYRDALGDSTELAEGVRSALFQDIAAHPELKARLKDGLFEWRDDDRLKVFEDVLASAERFEIHPRYWFEGLDEAYPLLSPATRQALLRMSQAWLDWDSNVPKTDYFRFLKPFLRHGDLPREQVEWLKRYFEREVEADPGVLHDLILLDSQVERRWFVLFVVPQLWHRSEEARTDALRLLGKFPSSFGRNELQSYWEKALRDESAKVRNQAYHLLGTLKLDPSWRAARLQEGLDDSDPRVRKGVLRTIVEEKDRLALPWLERKFAERAEGANANGLETALADLKLWFVLESLDDSASFSEIFSFDSPLKFGLRPEWFQRQVEQKLASSRGEIRRGAVLALRTFGQRMDPLWLRDKLEQALGDGDDDAVAFAFDTLRKLEVPWDADWLREKISAGLASPRRMVTKMAYSVFLELGNRVNAAWFKDVVCQNITKTEHDRRAKTYAALGDLARLSVFEPELLQSWVEQGLRDESEMIASYAGTALFAEGARFDPAWRRRVFRMMWNREFPSFSGYWAATFRELVRSGEVSRAEIERVLGLDRIPV